MKYSEFLKSKQVFIPDSGFDVEPVNAKLFDWQRQIVKWGLRKGRAGLFLDTGLGKAQPIDQPVLTPTGWVDIGELAPGDAIIAGDGSVATVFGVYPQGMRGVVKITFNDGSTCRCDNDHLWSVATDLDISRGNDNRTMTVREIVDVGTHCPDGRARWRIPMLGSGSIANDIPLAIDPYVLGVLIGDGCLTGVTVAYSKPDVEVRNEVSKRLPEGVRVMPTSEPDTFRIAVANAGYGTRNPVLDALRELGLMGKKSLDKFIPSRYFISSRSQRIDLLRGLMDTDGYASKEGAVQFSTSSEQLKNDVRQLVFSLGGTCRVLSKMPQYTYKGERCIGAKHWTLTLAIPLDVAPFLLPRKAARYSPRSKYVPQRKIAIVEKDGEAQCVCISISHPSQLYVTKDYIVTHNTLLQLVIGEEIVKRTGGKVLLLAPLAVSWQTLRESEKFGIQVPVQVVGDQSQIKDGISITNYEKLHKFDADEFVLVMLDEGSILKSLDGKTRDTLIEQFKHTPYRYVFTATPSPNDIMEIGSYCEFLGIMSRAEMLATYFTHDGGETSKWRLKGHAEKPFFRWMASWAVMIRKPSDIGYPDAGFDLPPLRIHEHVIQTEIRPEYLFQVDAQTLADQRQVRRATLQARVDKVKELANADTQEPWVVWCNLNDESTEASKVIVGAIEVTGSQSTYEKEHRLLAFTKGERRAIISKSSIAGFGLNWQHASHMAFVGLDHSYEAFYQAIRRIYRFGQTKPCDIHVVVSDQDGAILENIRRKQTEAERLVNGLVEAMRELTKAEIGSTRRVKNEYNPKQMMEVPSWLS